MDFEKMYDLAKNVLTQYRKDDRIQSKGGDTIMGKEIKTRQEIADNLREECFTTKEDLLEWLDAARERIKTKSETDIKHSAAFYHVYDNMLQKFISAIANTVLFERLEDFWHYSISLSDAGATLYLEHYTYQYYGEALNYLSDQSFTLLHIRGRMLTVDEYANTYGVTQGTVRQWIRRGKIRSAIKTGNEWRIPELTELPGRGYQAGFYMWYEPLKNLPEEYSFLNDYVGVLFNQDVKDKNLFHVDYVARGVDTREMTVDAKEREKIELFMITHPQIHFNGGPDDGLNVHIARKWETGFFNEYGAEENDNGTVDDNDLLADWLAVHKEDN